MPAQNLPEDQAVLLFQSVRELLLNVTKHSQSRQASICLEQKESNLYLEVQDTGIGFDLASGAEVR